MNWTASKQRTSSCSVTTARHGHDRSCRGRPYERWRGKGRYAPTIEDRTTVGVTARSCGFHTVPGHGLRHLQLHGIVVDPVESGSKIPPLEGVKGHWRGFTRGSRFGRVSAVDARRVKNEHENPHRMKSVSCLAADRRQVTRKPQCETSRYLSV